MSDSATTSRPGFGPRLLALVPETAIAAVLVALMVNEAWMFATLGIDIEGDVGNAIRLGFETIVWLAVAHLIQRWLRVCFWEGWAESRTGLPVPRLLVDMSGVVIYLAALTMILSHVFGLSVSGLLTTSSIMIAVVGFALRYLISDVFTGVALGAEQPFKIGDWIELDDGTVGKVQQMNWRATRILTKRNILVVIPNSQLATRHFRNFSAPDEVFRDEFSIVLDYSVQANRVERLFLSSVQQVPELAAVARRPEVRIGAFHPHGAEWILRFWLPDYDSFWRLKYKLMRTIYRNLQFSGMRVPGERMDIRALKRQAKDRDIDFLNGVDLFEALTEEELQTIDAKMDRRMFKKDDPVVSQGEPGQSLFILREGIMAIYVTGEDGREIRVNQIGPGAFFGEMSLLTGATRRATVVPEVDSIGFEITKETLEPILQKRPELIEVLSEALAERDLQTKRAFESKSNGDAEARKESLTKEFVRSIRHFFDLSLHH